MGVFLRFEDDSVESAKQVMQWNVKIINVREMSCIYSIAGIWRDFFVLDSVVCVFLHVLFAWIV